jgi:MFS family permease
LVRRPDEADFQRIRLGQAFSNLGDEVSGVAVLWWVRQTSGSNSAAFVMVLCVMVAALLAAPMAGAVVDRRPRRRVMIAADVMRAALSLAMIVAITWFGRDAVVGVVAIASIAAVPAAFFGAAISSSVTMLVSEERRTWANSMLGINTAMAAVVGSLVGGVLVGTIGVTSALWFDAATFVVSFALIARSTIANPITPEPSEPGEMAATSEGTWAGLVLLRRDRRIRDLTITAGGLSICVAPLPVLFVGFAAGPLALGARGYGALMGAIAAGMVVGLSGAARLAQTPSVFAAMMAVSLCLGASVLSLSWLVVGGALAGFGVGIGVTNAVLPTQFQSLVAPQVQGRVFAVVGALSQIGRPLGLAVGVVAAGALGVRASIGLCAVGLGLVTLAGRRTLAANQADRSTESTLYPGVRADCGDDSDGR